jgi:hypothetical protein
VLCGVFVCFPEQDTLHSIYHTVLVLVIMQSCLRGQLAVLCVAAADQAPNLCWCNQLRFRLPGAVGAHSSKGADERLLTHVLSTCAGLCVH